MSCTICGYGFPIADGDAVTLDFEKAKEFLKKHVGSFGQTDEEMQILDALEHAESEDAEEDELEDARPGLILSSTLQRMTSGRRRQFCGFRCIRGC